MKVTLDLDKDAHKRLKTFALENEVGAANVVRVLLKRLEEDDELRVKVQAELAIG